MALTGASKTTSGVIAFFEGLNKENSADAEYHKGLCTDTSILNWDWHIKPMQSTGAAGMAEVHATWWTTFPDLKCVAKDVIEDTSKPGKSVVNFDFTATPAKTGKALAFKGVLITMCDESGKLIDGTWYTDFTNLMIAGGLYDPCAPKTE